MQLVSLFTVKSMHNRIAHSVHTNVAGGEVGYSNATRSRPVVRMMTKMMMKRRSP